MVPYFSSKFGPFITNTTMRNIIGQPKSAFNIREVMDSGKVLLVNLSKGKIGDVNAQLLGLIFVNKVNMAAMSRADVPRGQRRRLSLRRRVPELRHRRLRYDPLRGPQVRARPHHGAPVYRAAGGQTESYGQASTKTRRGGSVTWEPSRASRSARRTLNTWRKKWRPWFPTRMLSAFPTSTATASSISTTSPAALSRWPRSTMNPSGTRNLRRSSRVQPDEVRTKEGVCGSGD